MSIVLLLKCLAVLSCKLEERGLSVLHIAPPRELKSYTSYTAMQLFSSDFWIDLGSDFTFPSLKRYQNDLIGGKCLSTNDLAILFNSKVQRSKDRIFGGFAEWLADGKYTYQDFKEKYSFIAKITFMGNITSASFLNNKRRFYDSTLIERLLVVHTKMSFEEKQQWVAKESISKDVHFDKQICTSDITTRVNIPQKYFPVINKLATAYSYASLSTLVSQQDIIKALVRANAALNRRSAVCSDDLLLAMKVRPYLQNPFSPYEGRIVELRAQGLSYSQIQKRIGKKNYNRQIQRVIADAKLRGILDA
jgi:hypothetical protein